MGGRRLAQNAHEQAWIFGAKFTFMQRVTGLHHEGDELAVVLAEDGPVQTRAVLLASGVEQPGRYTRWDVGFVDPPLVLVARGRDFRLTDVHGEVMHKLIA